MSEINKNEALLPVENEKEMFEFANADKTLHDTKFETKPISYLHDCLRRFAKNKASVVAGIIILLIVLFAIFEPLVDPKSYVTGSDYVNGYRDSVFANATPYNPLFKGTGFWDGTAVISNMKENTYNIRKLTDLENPNRPYIVELLEVNEEGGIFNKQKNYVVRVDTYAVGNLTEIISTSEYEKLLEYNEAQPDDQKVLKPLVDVNTYLEKARAKLEAEGVDASAISQLIDGTSGMKQYYQDNPSIYFEIYPVKGSNGRYTTTYEAVLDNSGKPINIYMTDENGDYIYAMKQNADYEVRVDYIEYYKFKNGFDPVFLFGCNSQGQDICLRLALGCRFSLLLGIGITIINFIIGLIWGAISGYYGGTADLIMERITDILSNVPSIIIMTIVQIQLNNNLALNQALGAVGCIVVAFLIAFVYNGWVGVSSTTRMQFYRFKGQEYVLASRTLGARDSRLIFKHILPNAAGTLVTSCVLMVPSVIFSESNLSYLGIIDFSTSNIVSLGAMLNDGQGKLSTYPHILLFPAIVISLLMISFNLFGNGLRDAFNTSLRGSED